jgi:hypothetical protein
MAPKGLLALDIDIEALFVQLLYTSSLQTLIELFINSSDGEEKMNFLVPKEFTSRTLARRVAWLRKVYKIKNIFKIKFSGLKWNLERWVLAACKWQ